MNQEDIRDFEMHEEYFEIDPRVFEEIARMKREKRRVIAVGTTMVRTLESLPVLWPLIKDRIDISDEGREYWDTVASNADTVRLFYQD